MDRRFTNVLVFLVAILAIFLLVGYVFNVKIGSVDFTSDKSGLPIRFLFVLIGLALAFAIYWFSRDNKAWEVGTREVVWMAIGAALYAVFSFLFNGTVFVVPSVSQVALRPAIAIPMFFGYAFGPVVGFFTGAVGNVFGDAISGFGFTPQWCVGNGLIGLVSGMVMLFSDKKRSLNTVLIVGGVLAALAVLLYFLFPTTSNGMYFDPTTGNFGQTQITFFAGIAIVIGFILVLVVRFAFGQNEEIAAAVTWGMLGNIIGILFAALSDIPIDGFNLPTAIVGEFLPAAGPNLIFAAILVPLLVAAYAAFRRQSGR